MTARVTSSGLVTFGVYRSWAAQVGCRVVWRVVWRINNLGGDWVAEVGAASGVAGSGDAVGFGEGRGAVGVECDGPVFGVDDGVMFGA